MSAALCIRALPHSAGILPHSQAAFPRAARLLKTDEFSSVFRLRAWRRSAHFVVYGRATGQAARLGLVIGKKYAPRAVTRNLVRRIAREAFRTRRAQFDGFDLLLRLHTRFDRGRLPSAASPPLKALCRDEIVMLFDNAAREIVKRTATQPVTENALVPVRTKAGRLNGNARDAAMGNVPTGCAVGNTADAANRVGKAASAGDAASIAGPDTGVVVSPDTAGPDAPNAARATGVTDAASVTNAASASNVAGVANVAGTANTVNAAGTMSATGTTGTADARAALPDAGDSEPAPNACPVASPSTGVTAAPGGA